MLVIFFVLSTPGFTAIRRSHARCFSSTWIPSSLGGLVLLGRPDSCYAIPPRPTHLRPHESRARAPLGSAPCPSGLPPILHARAHLHFSNFLLTVSNLRL